MPWDREGGRRDHDASGSVRGFYLFFRPLGCYQLATVLAPPQARLRRRRCATVLRGLTAAPKA